MTIIFLDPQRDIIVAELNNVDDDIYWDDVHEQSVDGVNTLSFKCLTSSHIPEDRARILVRAERVGWQEFIMTEKVVLDDIVEVYATGSEQELDKLKNIPPAKYEGWTLEQYFALLVQDTGYQVGFIEYSGTQTLEFEDDMGGYSFSRLFSKAFGVEPALRIELKDNQIAGRYLDAVERQGSYKGKEIEYGKDLIGIERRHYPEREVTGLLVIGPEREDGTRLKVTVTDDDAFQRWNRNGQHLIERYEPQTDDKDMTVARLEALGRTELKKRIDSIDEYVVKAAVIESEYPNEYVGLGDPIRVKNTEYTPPLYAEARVLKVTRGVSDVGAETKEYEVGNVVLYDEDDILAEWKVLQKQYGMRVIKSPTAPPGNPNIIWIKTEVGSDFEIAHTWNGSEWIAITPTRAEQIGAETPEGAQDKADQARQEAKEYAESRAEWERLQGHAVQLLTEKAGYEQQFNEAYNAPTLYTPAIKSALLAAWNEYLAKFNALYNAISSASADEAITQAERDDIELKTIAYRAAVANFEAKHSAALKDIAAGLAKDAEDAATDFTEMYAQKEISQGLVAPSNPVGGDLWIDTSLDPYQWKQWNGTSWVILDRTNLAQFDGQIDASQIAPNAVTAEKIVNGSITTIKIGDLAVDATKIAAGAILTDKLVDGAITTIKLGNLAVDNSKLAANAVTATKILDGAIAEAKIAAGAVTELKIGTGAITNLKLAALAVDAAKLAAGAVTDIKLATGAVTNEKLANLAVDAAKLAEGSITATKIADLAVGNAAIQNGAITNAKILDAAITTAKIGDAQITAAKIAALAVGTAAIQDAAITNAKVGALDASKITTGRLDAARVQIGSGTEFAAGYDPTLIQVGGRNLLTNSGSFKDLTGWAAGGGSISLADKDGFKTIYAPTTVYPMTGNLQILEPNTEYVVTVEAMFESNYATTSATPNHLYVRKVSDNSNATVSGFSVIGGNRTLQANKWEKVSVSFKTIDTTDALYLKFHLYVGSTSVNKWLKSVKIEKGNKATDWTPAPEDNPALLWQFSDTTFIDGGKIYTNTVTANQIAAGTITAAQIASGTITATQIATNAITTDKINANAVTTAKINTGAVTANEIATNAVTAVKIAAGTITAAEIAGLTITGDKIAANAITAAKILAGTITANELATNSVTTIKIATGSVTANEIATNAITAVKINAGAIETVKLAANAVTADKIAANTITAAQIAANTITSNLIATAGLDAGVIKFGTMSGARIAANTITTTQLAAGSITAASGIIADLAITSAKIADLAVTGAKIANASITDAKIQSLSASKLVAGSVISQDITFTGKLASGLNTDFIQMQDGEIRAHHDAYTENGRTLLNIKDSPLVLYDGNTLNGDIFPRSQIKTYVHTVNVPVPAASYTTNSNILYTLNITDSMNLGMQDVYLVMFQAISKEWRAYEELNGRVFDQGELSSIKGRISPNYAYTSGGTTVQVQVIIIGSR
ncbi:hypothetical protein LG275_03700 [Chryseomicrobium palamuruense]